MFVHQYPADLIRINIDALHTMLSMCMHVHIAHVLTDIACSNM